MILTVDIGNSNTCFALHTEDTPAPLFFERVRTDRSKDARFYLRYIEGMFSLHGISPCVVSGAILSSVVPPVTDAVTEALAFLIPARILRVRHDLDLGFSIHVDDPSTVGTDILSDVAGAVASYGSPVVTFDMGTATVCSFTDASPALSGILIMAGVRTSLNALSGGTSMLPSIALLPTDRVIAKNTQESMRSGILYGTAGMIDEIAAGIREETGAVCRTVLTGGLSPFVAPYCRSAVVTDRTLLMRGLWTIYKRNA
ncbi:MAG: type III pantothenate kinase [Lachnospiraceae bacterium]|nr:type III pantothenate kinase [Lachnospiraceae bacterium]